MDSKPPARLDELIDYVKNQRPDGDALDRLTAAMMVSEHLDEVADHLIGHFVDQARRAGASWTEIGQSMGVSKQAAQKRFVPGKSAEPLASDNVFARFTSQARQAVVAAQEEARQTQHDYIGTEHVVLGLLTVPNAIAVETVTALGHPPEDLRAAVVAALGPVSEAVPAHIPFTPQAKKVLELTIRESLRLGHNYVGTEHILLGLLGIDEGLGTKILVERGLTKEQAESWIIPTLRDGRREDTP